MEIITFSSQNKRKKTINWVFIALSLTYRALGGGGVSYKNRTEMLIALLYRGGQVPTFKGANVHPLI